MKFSQISADVTWDILTAYVDIVGLVSIYQVKKLLKSFNGIVVASGTGLDLTWMDLLDSLPSNQNKCWDVLLHPNCSVGSLLSMEIFSVLIFTLWELNVRHLGDNHNFRKTYVLRTYQTASLGSIKVFKVSQMCQDGHRQ